MSVTTAVHLNFTGQAREALEFYAAAVDGQLTVATYGQFGAPADSPDADKVVFGQVTSANGFSVMAYDIPSAAGATPTPRTVPTRQYGMTLTSEPFFVALRGDTLDEVAAIWEKLAEGATVVEPLAPSQWSPGFGMLTDKFGQSWVIDVAPPQQG